jgi:hypothetical protein
VSDDFFTRPRLRDGVTVDVRAGSVALDYRRQGCAIDIPVEAEGEARALFARLAGGETVDGLRGAAPGFADGLPELLAELDRLGLLTEGAPAERPLGRTGLDLYREARRCAARTARAASTSRMFRALQEGSVTRAVLVGYAVEYYHLVRSSPALIAPALAHATTPATYDQLLGFVSSELGHDAMLRESLSSVGIGEDVLAELVPLPSNLAVCATLGVLAAQDPLSFKACLFLFEEPAVEFNAAVAERARALGMPDAFAAPMIRHATINDDADHDDISRALLAEVAFVSDEERRVVLKHLTALTESYVAFENEILDWYGAADEPRLRRYGRLS